MDNGYELLTEKEEMWARMLMEALEDNGVPCVAVPVLGAGLVVYTGARERLKVYVPGEKLEQAKALLEELFAGE